MSEHTYLYVGDVFYKTMNYKGANLQKFPIKWILLSNSQTLPVFLCDAQIRPLPQLFF